MEVACAPNCKMGIREYIETIVAIIRSPAKHFESVASETGSRRALLFLMISGIFYCSVSMTYFFENSLMMGIIMMVNAIMMPALGAVFTFSLLGMTTQKRVPYGRVFNIYAYASGAVMVISWIPGLVMIMEPLRAILVAFTSQLRERKEDYVQADVSKLKFRILARPVWKHFHSSGFD